VKVGKYTIPKYRLHPKLFEATKTLYEKFGSEEATNLLTVAQLLEHKSDRSGSFINKLSDLRSYGLITKRGVKVTDLGKKLTYDPSDEERDKALRETLLNIPLWNELYSRFGKNLPTTDLWVELTKFTGLEAPDAKKTEKSVQNAYLSDFRYLKEEKKPKMEGLGMQPSDQIDTSLSTSEDVLGRVVVKDAGYIDVKDKTTYEIAKAYLKIFAEKLRIKEEG